MSVLDFPSSPTNGQYYAGFVWNEANSTWDSAFAPRAATIPISSPNYIINGAFEINQRNFSSTTANGTFGFDRWSNGSNRGTVTYSSQTVAPGTISVGGIDASNSARMAISGQSEVDSFAVLVSRMENVGTLSGTTVTVSFWAKANSGTPKVAIELEQIFGSGGSSSVQTPAGFVTMSTAWARYSVTVNIPSISGKTVGSGSHLALNFWFSAGSSFNARASSIGIQNNTFDIWGVQVEAGAAPTEFRRNAPNIQGELAACRRYFQVYGNSPNGNFTVQTGIGASYSTANSAHVLQFDTPMRTSPSITISNVIDFNVDLVGVASAGVTAIAFNAMTENMTRVIVNFVSNASFGSHKAVLLIAANTGNARIYVSAEL
jgi:hypothetical protein